MDVETLRKLNQLRTFARGFDHLQAGDELDVPLSPLPAITWHDAPASPDVADRERETKVASAAVSTGSFLANNPNREAAAALARGMATGKANAELQQWLGRSGTARVQLDTDKNLSLKNSRLDLLLPVSDQKKQLLFTQGSLHRTDDRAQANLGVGIRHFADDFMAGFNTFLDYDLSRQHARSGVGVEYWRDFLKLGANGYLGLSGWKDTPDIADYKERPARGWDLRTDAWLPGLPHLGAKLNYEKYYGREVALFGKDNRQKDPYALTAGLHFTPFPLLTLSAERRQGSAAQSDHLLGAQLNYQLGVPWKHQTDSSRVDAMRNLAGSRYDLVERNNNIVLEYRKNEVIRLRTVNLIKGYAGEQKSLGVAIKTKYPLAHINWSAAALLANGGQIIANGPADYSIILPNYQYGDSAINTYLISGVAVDAKGNTSRKAETQVTVTQAEISQANSTLTPTESRLPADGKTNQTLTLTVKDSLGHPVDIDENEITMEKTAQLEDPAVGLTAFKRQSAGQYTAVVTAGTRPQTLTISAAARNTTFPTAKVLLTPYGTTAQLASLSVISNKAVANGKDENQVKAVIKDVKGNPVAEQTVLFSADNGASIVQSVSTNQQGEALATVSSLKAGESTVTARYGDHDSKNIQLSFTADATTAALHSLEIIENGAVADGQAVNKIKVTVKDANGNPVPNQRLYFSANRDAAVPESALTDEKGEAIATVTSLKAGEITLTARTENGSTGSVKVIFIADASTALLAHLAVMADNAVADGKAKNKVKVIIADANGNLVPGQTVNFTADNSAIVTPSAVTDEKGEAIATVTSLKRGLSNITASIADKMAKSASVTFLSEEETASINKFEVIKDNAVADGIAENKLRLTVRYATGNPAANAQVTLKTDDNVQLAANSVTTANDGTAIVAVTSKVSGAHTLSAAINNHSASALVTFVPGEIEGSRSTFTLSKNTFAADGTDTIVLTFIARDKNNNIVKNAPIAFTSTGINNSTIGSINEQDGTYTASLTSSQAGIGKVSVLFGGKEIANLKARDIGAYRTHININVNRY